MNTPWIEAAVREGRLAAIEMDDEEIASRWEKALRAFSDAQVSSLSPEGAFVRACSGDGYAGAGTKG